MAKSANPGELRTMVRFVKLVRTHDAAGLPVEKPETVYESVPVKWVNAHGTELWQSMELKLREPATLTLRYAEKVRQDLLVYKAGDARPYEIISIDNVEERGAWMEIKVQRRVSAV